MLVENTYIKVGEIKIAPTTKLLCYTDGLVETENFDNIEFGTKEIENCISNKKSIGKIVVDIVKKVENHKGEKTYFDDISLIGIEFL